MSSGAYLFILYMHEWDIYSCKLTRSSFGFGASRYGIRICQVIGQDRLIGGRSRFMLGQT